MNEAEARRWMAEGWLCDGAGRWYQPDPTHCALGLPMTEFLRGWEPCGGHGHAYRYCRHHDHGHTEADRFRYHPPKSKGCHAPRRMAPSGELEAPS